MMDIRITLDPVYDGPVIRESVGEKKERGALIIATNGERRMADFDEAADLLNRLSETGYGDYMGKTHYMIMVNKDKLLEVGESRFLIGTAIIVKYNGDGIISLLSEEDAKEAEKEFESRLCSVVWGREAYSAYEL